MLAVAQISDLNAQIAALNQDRDNYRDLWEHAEQERDDLAVEVRLLQAGAYDHGYQRADDVARERIEQLVQELEAAREREAGALALIERQRQVLLAVVVNASVEPAVAYLHDVTPQNEGAP